MKDKNNKQFVHELTELRSQNAALQKSITGSISAELAAEESGRYAESIVETIREPLLVLDADLKIISANRNFYKIFKVTPHETIGSFIYNLGNKQWDIPKLRELLETIPPEKATFDKYEVEHEFATIGRRIMLLNARHIERALGKEQIILLAIEDITELKQAEEEVIENNEKRFRELIESLPQLFWTCKVDGPCDYLSKQWVEYTGIPEADQLGYRWLEQLHPEDRDKTVSEWMEKVKTGKSFDVEFRIRRNDDVYHWFKTTAVPMRDAEGNILKCFGSNTDIDKIKKAEEQLRKLNRIYSLLSDINQVIVRTRVLEEMFKQVSNIAVEQGGFGMAWIGLIDESSEKLRVIAQAGRTNGYHEKIDISLNNKPLSYCPIDSALRQEKHNICNIIENERMAPCQKIAYELGFRSSASFPLKVSDILRGALTFYSDEPEFFDEKELKLLDELALDISFAMEYAEKETQRKQGEEALKTSEERFRIAAETSNDLMYEWDLKQEVTWFGKIDERLGYAPGEFPRTLEGLGASVHPEDWVRVMAAVQAHLEGRAPYAEDYRVLMKDGTFRWWSARGAVARMPDGKPVRWIGTVTDITERKLAEEEIKKLNTELEQRVLNRTAQLSAANEELEAFSYSVSHDLRAPLRSIDGFSHALLEEYQEKLDDTGKGYLERVRKATLRMGLLIDNMLNLSRINRAELKNESFDLSRMIRAIAEANQKSNSDRAVDVTIQEGIMVQGDPYLIKIAMENLVDNAFKFTAKEAHPRIEFGTTVEEDKTAYYVRDNGAGFDMTYVGKLFGAFQRLHTKEEFTGTGIGLATVKRIIVRHGGQIWAEGEVGKGATFYFTLP